MHVINRKRIRALKDKWVAGVMMLREDYIGARNKLLDAQLLHPGLDNMDLMLAICDILKLDSDIKLLHGETAIDVLVKHFKPSASTFEAKRYFQNLLTSMHAIRDEFPGTDSAIELVQTAFLIITDREEQLNHEVREGRHEFSGLVTSSNDISLRQALGGEEGPFRSDESTFIEAERRNLRNDVAKRNTLQMARNSFQTKLTAQQEAIDIESVPKDEVFKSNWCSEVLVGEDAAFRSDESTFIQAERQSLPVDLASQNAQQTTCKSFQTKLTAQQEAINIESLPKDEVFKSNWCSDNFAIGQIWAVYWGKDSLPRQYTQIVSVISDSQVYVTLLEPLAVLGHETDWRQEKIPIACGTFKANDIRLNLNMSQFSHPVKCQRIMCGSLYRIFPLKGEIWAMYKNWNCKWKKTDRDGCQHQIVQILSDFADGDEMRVTRMQEVMGYQSLFKRNELEGFYLTRRVSKSDMLSFCHRIPAYRVSGMERYGMPETCWHLEPKAMPPNEETI